MRILFVCTDADVGGAERLLVALAKNWPVGDTLKLVVLMEPGTLSEQLEEAFAEVEYLGFPPTSRNLLGMVRSLERVVREFEPDLISSHLFHADLVAALSRTPVPKASTMHTHGLGPDDHPLTRLIARVVGALSFRFAAVIPSSDSDQMATFMSKLRMKRVTQAILNGADIAPAPTFDPNSRTVLSVARNHPVKGHHVLFEAFARAAQTHPDWSLEAYGPGIEDSDASMQAALGAPIALEAWKSGRIILEGPTSDPNSVLATGAVLVISSLYGETLPLIGAEAAGVGLPVITTKVGNCAEFADDPRFVVEPGSVGELAQALETYMDLSDEDRLALSKAARDRAEERYRPDVVAGAYRDAYARLALPGGA